jgi:hypothetical protein
VCAHVLLPLGLQQLLAVCSLVSPRPEIARSPVTPD